MDNSSDQSVTNLTSNHVDLSANSQMNTELDLFESESEKKLICFYTSIFTRHSEM